jgi:calcineurin-like phosphoesterase family protein
MNEALIDIWNSVVSDDDEVWILGDLCMGKLDENLKLAKRLNGHKILVAGNHDRFSPAYHGNMTAEKRESWRHRYADEAGISECYTGTISTTVEGFGPVDMCHFPYLEVADHVDDRESLYDPFRPVDNGRPLLHGHVHGAYGAQTGPKSIDVGIDVPDWGFAPVPESVIAERLNAMVGAA